MQCKNCFASDLTILDKTYEYSFLKCNSCSFFFKDIVETNYESLLEENYISYNFDRNNEVIELDNVIKKFCKKNKIKVLEIGSGTGSLSNALMKRGYEVIGVEPNSAAFQLSQRVFPNVEVINNYFSSTLILKEIDVILLYDVVEHLEPNNKLFKEIQNIMDENTLLLFKSGNPLSFNARLSISHWRYVLIDQHISFYSEKALKKFCEKRNLKLIKYYKFQHCYGGFHFTKILKNVFKLILKKIHIDIFFNRDFTIDLANDHFIAIIKK